MTRNASVQTDLLHVVEPRAAGLDIHKLQVTASTRLCPPDGGEPLGATREFRTTPAGLAEMTAWLLGQGVEAAAMEGTGIYWEPPFAALESAGLRVCLLHAQQVKQLRGRKTDLKDSQWLARVCQFGLGTPSSSPPLAFRDLRRMTRNRRTLIIDRSRARNRVQKLLDRNGLQLGGALSDIFGVNGRCVLEGLAEQWPTEQILASLTAHVRPKLRLLAEILSAKLDTESLCQLRGHLQACDHASGLVSAQDRRIAATIAPWQHQLDLLETIPGIDRASACAILAEIGPTPAQDFADAAHLGAWAGVCPGNNISAGKRRSGRARAGNRHLRQALAECAHGAARTKGSQFAGYYRALTARRGSKRAILATAYKLLRTVYAVLREERHYRDPSIDYEQLHVQRNAPRWMAKLRKFGYIPAPAEAP
ncbi:MAG: IS110 family transposase [Alphaproteobacteria bacterium]|nr:IS110 family transposase [Alphaproteobacteria bacterium]